jgi:hypothetical protein
VYHVGAFPANKVGATKGWLAATAATAAGPAAAAAAADAAYVAFFCIHVQAFPADQVGLPLPLLIPQTLLLPPAPLLLLLLLLQLQYCYLLLWGVMWLSAALALCNLRMPPAWCAAREPHAFVVGAALLCSTLLLLCCWVCVAIQVLHDVIHQAIDSATVLLCCCCCCRCRCCSCFDGSVLQYACYMTLSTKQLTLLLSSFAAATVMLQQQLLLLLLACVLQYECYMTSSTCIVTSLTHKEIVILGTQYAGESKKGIWT